MAPMPFELMASLMLAAGVSLGMVRIALKKQALDPRRTRRRCPACGISRDWRGRCPCSGRNDS
jgi:hypothetical protein